MSWYGYYERFEYYHLSFFSFFLKKVLSSFYYFTFVNKSHAVTTTYKCRYILYFPQQNKKKNEYIHLFQKEGSMKN